jgi:hypothetical protein
MHFSPSCFALLVFASLPAAGWGDSAYKSQEFTQLEHVWNEAHVHGDARALDEQQTPRRPRLTSFAASTNPNSRFLDPNRHRRFRRFRVVADEARFF